MYIARLDAGGGAKGNLHEAQMLRPTTYLRLRDGAAWTANREVERLALSVFLGEIVGSSTE